MTAEGLGEEQGAPVTAEGPAAPGKLFRSGRLTTSFIAVGVDIPHLPLLNGKGGEGPVRISLKLVAIAAALSATASCSFGPQCSEGGAISERALLDVAVSKIVKRSLASTNANEIKYSSLAHFYSKSPACCYLSRGKSTTDKKTDLPISQDSELTVIYQEFYNSARPYQLRHVAIGPCPSNQEESWINLSVEEFRSRIGPALGSKIL